MRLALLDGLAATPWSDAPHRLAHLVPVLARLGHSASPIDAGTPAKTPTLAGFGREGDVAPLIEANRIVARVAAMAPDWCLAPLRGGLAHGILMARACGELPAGLRVALIAEEPSRDLVLRGDLPLETPMRLLIADAMERFCLAEADALLCSDPGMLQALGALGANLPPVTDAPDFTISVSVLVRTPGPPSTIAFVGPFTRAGGVVAFIDAIERLAATGDLAERSVVFIGPIEDTTLGPGKSWLGRRAAAWPFRFRVHETANFADALALATRPGGLAFAPDVPRGLSADRLATVPAGSSIEYVAAGLPVLDGSGIEAMLRRPARGPGAPPRALWPEDPAAAGFLQSPTLPRPGDTGDSSSVGLSVCILHRDRPDMLRLAVESVVAQLDGGEIEIVVLDNASTVAGYALALDELGQLPCVSIVRLDAAVPPPTGLNLLAARARQPFVAFLDDDNVLADGGLARLRRACALGRFDVVTSTLDVFDEGALVPGPTMAKMAFIGPAATAGLFFNGFGDTSMAVRREAFTAIGGFEQTPGPHPAWDWVLLAKAQAAGLRIGVLQQPAFRYRRDLHKQEVHWQKYDQHGVRQAVLRVYADRFDPRLLAKLAQGLMLDRP